MLSLSGGLGTKKQTQNITKQTKHKSILKNTIPAPSYQTFVEASEVATPYSINGLFGELFKEVLPDAWHAGQV